MKSAAQPRSKRTSWLSRALLLLLPLVLALGAWGVHHWQQLHLPISIGYGPEDIESRVLFERMAKEAREHPYARTILVSWSKPWPKESGLDLYFSESLDFNRSEGTLEYGISDDGWTYKHVELSGIELLAHSRLPRYPTRLSASLDAQLRKRGWTPE